MGGCMYDWRTMTSEQRREALAVRKSRRYPWHGPPASPQTTTYYHVTAACYEHLPLIGRSPGRLTAFEEALLRDLEAAGFSARAWCVLPNHYHALIWAQVATALREVLGRLHGRTSYAWNQEEGCRGRKVWHRVADRHMRCEDHFWATTNYIHHNAVKHGYARSWEDWPWSSAAAYLETRGRAEALRIWREYPVLDYGKGWDEF
ncbi:MAG: transposase [Planctomycetes bacterium]|nr:transposase [Planctomycetota bacterium]